MDLYLNAQSRGFEIREKNTGSGSHHGNNSPPNLISSYLCTHASMCVVASNSLSSHRVLRVLRWSFAACSFDLTFRRPAQANAGVPRRSIPSFPRVVTCQSAYCATADLEANFYDDSLTRRTSAYHILHDFVFVLRGEFLKGDLKAILKRFALHRESAHLHDKVTPDTAVQREAFILVREERGSAFRLPRALSQQDFLRNDDLLCLLVLWQAAVAAQEWAFSRRATFGLSSRT